MSSPSHDSTRRLLDAALTLFTRHGYRRTSMADIAVEARVARATLYLRFRDKAALFTALTDSVIGDALGAAQAAWRAGDDLAENLEAAILAKDLPFHHLLHGTPHGAELLGVDEALTRANAKRLDRGFTTLLAEWAAGAARDGADFGAFDGAGGFAWLLCVTSNGLKHELADEAAYRKAVRTLCRVAAHAARQPVLRG